MRFFSIMMLFFCANNLFAQKPIIDSTAYKVWPTLDEPTISKNGKYVFYKIENVPVGSKTLIVQSTDGKWKKEFRGGMKDRNGGALSDRYFFFINKNDSLSMLTLGTNQIKYIPNISWCNLLAIKGVEYLRYPSGHNPKDFVLKNLKTNKERVFTDVDSYSFEEDILVLVKSVPGTNQRQSINLVNITTGKVSKIWEGYKPENLILDAKHRQLAFKAGDSVWYYKFDSANAVSISDIRSSSIEPGLALGYIDSFSKDGKFLFTSLIGKKESIERKNGVVEIWSYRDLQLPTEHEKDIVDLKYKAIIDVENHRLIRLQQREGELFQFSKSGDNIAAVALVESPQVNGSPWAYERSWDLITLKNGNRKHLNFLDINNIGPSTGGVILSPSGKYILYFDRQKQSYFSYEITTEKIQNLTKGISVLWANKNQDDLPGALSYSRGLAAWLKDDESVLVYDRYDIWKLDLLNKEKPLNLTNDYGRKNGIVFNLTFDDDASRDSRLYLSAFNTENKNNGFFLKQLNKAGDPMYLHMGPYLYQTNAAEIIRGVNDFLPIKAKNAEMYIVRRMSATDAPNYFSTTDFKTFTRLTDLQPQKKYNWYTTELHSWKSLDGRAIQGILYKPENFDRNKKYPVIFHYYERKSDGLNINFKPELCDGCNIDIPTYVSRGYLVFSPDIFYKVGDPMQGTYDAVVSAASYVSRLPFVNAKKMGLQGCSWGGLQTNYLVTCTSSLFAAACSSSGVANLISCYGSLDGNYGNSQQQSYFENGQARMGISLWDDPGSYIKNSPIFHLEKVTTPLLIMHTRNDSRFAFSDAVGLFTGLRRLGKKSWMLAYIDEDHALAKKENLEDFGTRMIQFFDHYLKDKPVPVWMLDSLGVENGNLRAGLELDRKRRAPGPGLLTDEEQHKVELMMTRKPITITLK